MGLLQGNLEVLDTRHDDIRADMEAFIAKVGGEKQAQENLVTSTQSLFLEGLNNNPRVYEGFEPITVTREIAERHYQGIVDCIRSRDYGNGRLFSKVEIA